MSQRERETEFLRRMLVREDSAERQQLQSQLDEAEQRLRCIRRTARFVGFLMALSAAGLGYGLVFLPGIIERRPHFLLQFFYTVLTGCLISLAIYSIDWLWQSHLASLLREQCRQLLLDEQRKQETTPTPFLCERRFRSPVDGLVNVARSLAPAAGESASHRAP